MIRISVPIIHGSGTVAKQEDFAHPEAEERTGIVYSHKNREKCDCFFVKLLYNGSNGVSLQLADSRDINRRTEVFAPWKSQTSGFERSKQKER